MLIIRRSNCINTLNAELNPMCHFQILLGTHHILHVSRIRVNTASGIVLSVSEHPVCRLRRNSFSTSTTTPDAVLIQFDLLMMSRVLLETCRGLQQ